MKNLQYICVFIALAALVGVEIASAAPDAMPALEVTKYRWHAGAGDYEFLVTGRNGQAEQLEIVAPDKAIQRFKLSAALVTMKAAMMDDSATRDNLVPSRYLYLSPKLRSARGEPMLFFFGQGEEGDPGSVRLLELDETGHAKIVFSDETFLLTDISVVDPGKTPAIIGMRSLSQEDSDCVYTYDPYAVVQRSAQNDTFQYSESLSQKYNIAHYGGWAGPKSREDIAVVGCSRAHSRIMSLQQAQKLPKQNCKSC